MSFENPTFLPSFLESEDIIAKLHFVEYQESRWPYGPARSIPLHVRISEALSSIPKEFRNYALAIFSNIIYLPNPLLHASWRFLAEKTAQRLGISAYELITNSHIFEVDPSGLKTLFMRENEIHGRLDTDRFPRFPSVNEFASDLLNLLHNSQASLSPLKLLLSKRYWIIISDNVMSGTSLQSDLKRLNTIAQSLNLDPVPTILPLAQILTVDAKNRIKETCEEEIISALYFDSTYKISPDNTNCALFQNTETLEGVRALCKWFALQDWYLEDTALTATFEKSGDHLEFGFKNGGWTFVTPNCPTNSLPILWYENDMHYKAPYPRIMSRESQQAGATSSILDQILNNIIKINEIISPS